MSAVEFKQYIINLDKHNIKLYQIKKELIIYIARETINVLYKENSNKLQNFDVLYIYKDLESLDIKDIVEMSKKEDLTKCAKRYLMFL